MGLVVPQSNGVARRGQDMSAPSLIKGDHGTIPVAMCHWKARACASWSRAGDRARGQGGGDPEVVIEWFRGLDFTIARIRLEAGPLPQWMDTDMRKPDLILELLETRRVTNAFEVLRSAKTPCIARLCGWAGSVRSIVSRYRRRKCERCDSAQTFADEEPQYRVEPVRGGGRLPAEVGAATQRTFAGRIRFDRDVTEDKNMDLQLGASRSASRNEI
jgi:hypothetical protein